MANKEMKTLTFGDVTYEIVDEKARNDIKNVGKPNGIASLDETGKVPYGQLPELGEKYDVGGEELGLVKNGGNVTINPDGTMAAPEFFNPEASYGETDKYYFEGEEEQLVLANYGVTLPFEGITSAYKLNAEITKEQLDAITSVRLISFANWDMFRFDLTEPLAENTYGSIYSLGDLGIIIVGFNTGIIPLTLSETVSINVPIPSKGIFMVIPDENYNMLANNCVLDITGGTITAKKYAQIDDKCLPTPPDLNLDIPDDIGCRENGGIRMVGASEVEDCGFAVGAGAKALNKGAFALGGDCTVEGCDGKSMGTQAHASENNATAIGYYVWARGKESIVAGGYQNEADGEASFAANRFNKSKGYASAVFGSDNIASGNRQFVVGSSNDEDTQNKYLFIVGGGSSHSIGKRNIHTVDWNGLGYFAQGTTMTGADYAEYFEWLDGNPDNEDRVGLLVTLDGEKIKLANAGDEVLGIISGTAAVLGDNYECEWNGKYLTDDFGRVQYEDVEEFYEVIDYIDEETKEPVMKEESLGFFKRPILNPDYDPNKEYINRADRPEWSEVGMLGKLFVRDDGTCEVNGYATVGEGGVATKSDEKTNMRVLSRVNENVVRVLLK